MHRATLVILATLTVTLLVNIASVAAAQNGVAVEHSVTVDGISRKYLVFAPKEFDKPLPVVLALPRRWRQRPPDGAIHPIQRSGSKRGLPGRLSRGSGW